MKAILSTLKRWMISRHFRRLLTHKIRRFNKKWSTKSSTKSNL